MQDRLKQAPQRAFATDSDLAKYCAMGVEVGATHAKQVHPSSVVTAPWVRLKCQYGCPGYGHGHCCPPYTSTPEQTRAVLDSYHRAILFHIELPHMPHKEKHYKKYFDKLVDLEGEIFKDGFYKAFLGVAVGRCVYIGDMPIDAEAARAAGMTCFLAPTGGVERSELELCRGVRVVADLAEAVRIVVGDRSSF